MGLHQPYSLITSAGNMPDLDHKIKRANEQFHEWHVYWDGYYGAYWNYAVMKVS